MVAPVGQGEMEDEPRVKMRTLSAGPTDLDAGERALRRLTRDMAQTLPRHRGELHATIPRSRDGSRQSFPCMEGNRLPSGRTRSAVRNAELVNEPTGLPVDCCISYPSVTWVDGRTWPLGRGTLAPGGSVMAPSGRLRYRARCPEGRLRAPCPLRARGAVASRTSIQSVWISIWKAPAGGGRPGSGATGESQPAAQGAPG